MIPIAVRTAFADVVPEVQARMNAFRWSDQERVARMLATDPSEWADEDVDVVMAHAQTTLGGPETFKWVLPAFLDRFIENPEHGWMTISSVLAEKLDHAGFDEWPHAQRAAILEMLAKWLTAQATLFPDDPTHDPTEENAVLRRWFEART